MKLYEILIPATNNKGKRFDIDYHRKWDASITQHFSTGLTIVKNLYHGKWRDEEVEPFIPVRICCGPITLEAIMAFTKDYYKQESVMAYEISPNVIFYP